MSIALRDYEIKSPETRYWKKFLNEKRVSGFRFEAMALTPTFDWCYKF